MPAFRAGLDGGRQRWPIAKSHRLSNWTWGAHPGTRRAPSAAQLCTLRKPRPWRHIPAGGGRSGTGFSRESL